MLKYFFLILIAMAGIFMMDAGLIKHNKKITRQPDKVKPGFAVVELFTSEGCSSCPPADKVIAALLEKRLANVFILAYHVDYWNRLGWTDPFSKAAFSEKQRSYADAFGLQSVYTPQVVINGAIEFVGSDEDKLNAVVNKSLGGQQDRRINITMQQEGSKIMVFYKKEHATDEPYWLNIALVQPEANVFVKRGENSGRKLQHVNIVRDLRTIEDAQDGSTELLIPGDMNAKEFKIIAYSQSKKNSEIIAATELIR